MAKIPMTAFGRSFRLMKSGAKVLGQEVASRFSSGDDGSGSHQTAKFMLQAREVVSTLGEMKGAAMKLGQLLSLELSDLLPPEVNTILRELHDSVAAMERVEVERILLREFGPTRFKEIQELSEKPIGAASIGQVHSARIAGRDVVLKIQYPGVAGSIDADLRVLKTMTKSLLKMSQRDIDVEPLFASFAESLKNETDYRKEANNLVAYRATIGQDTHYAIPEPLKEWCTANVLTMERMYGVPLSEYLQRPLSQAERMHLALLAIRLFNSEFFQFGLVQSDPNFGNFLFDEKDKRFILLDCGALHRYSFEMRDTYIQLVEAGKARDRVELERLGHDMVFLDPRESPETCQKFVDLLILVADLFQADKQPVQFSEEALLARLRDEAKSYAASVRFSAPPQNVVFLNRKLGGFFHLLKELRVAINLAELWQEALSLTKENG